MTTTTARRTAWHLRLWLGVAVAVGVLLLPGLSRAEALTLSAAALTYVLGATLFDAIAARRPAFPARVLTPLLGVAAIELVIVVIPRALGAGLVLFLLVVTFSAYVGGLRLGLWLSAAAVPGAVLANAIAPEADRIDGGTVIAFAVIVPVLAVLTGRLTAERRRTAVALARLHDALEAAEEQPDLATTLDSIAASVGHAVRARVAGVVLRDRDKVTVAAWTTGASAPTPAEAEQLTRAELELGSSSPLAVGLSARRPLVVDDFHDDARLRGWSGPWAKVLRDLGCRSLVLVPLRLGQEVIGALAAAYSHPRATSVDDLAFLEAFADRAAPVAVRARAFHQERESAEQLALLDRQKGEFLALVSHELRTPLTAVKGFVDTVLEHWQTLPDPRRRELLDRASSNADELNRLVGQLLDFARLDAADVRMHPRRIHVCVEIANVLENLAPVLAEHPVEMDIPAGAEVVADPKAFADVLTNLLTNAAKFSPDSAPITVRAEADGADLVLSVTDHGVGIPLDEQARVFDRFYQSPSNLPSQRGTGIGLTIAKRFTEMQGGRISVMSEPGLGTTFFVSMPAATSTTVRPEREGVPT
ncbi:MAG TPA: GAF domain-containing sensor histidine kinase [Acidimicrobiia bacterium]